MGMLRSDRNPSCVGRMGAAVLLVCAALLTLSVAACDDRPLPAAVASDMPVAHYQLGPGDALRINVFGDDTLSGQYKVAGDGKVVMPLVGAVKAAGATTADLTTRIESRLSEYVQHPKVDIQLLTKRPVYIIGEVRNPGSYTYVDGMTVIKAVAIAGGFTYRAKTNRFIIDRTAPKGGAMTATAETPLLPGDVVTVQERYF